jgi:hypothetical protein
MQLVASHAELTGIFCINVEEKYIVWSTAILDACLYLIYGTKMLYTGKHPTGQ